MGDNDRPRIVIELDPALVNKGVDSINTKLADLGGRVVSMSTTSRSALDRLSASVERQAALYGKTGIERLVALRDIDIKKCGDNQKAVDKLTDAYGRMIAKQAQMESAAKLEATRTALDHLTSSAEKQAQVFGKSGIEKLSALRDIDIKKANGNKEAIDSLNASYGVMIAKQKELDEASSSWTTMAAKVGALLLTMEAFKTVIKDVAVETALFAAKAKTYEVAMEAAGVANNASVQGLHQQETALRGQGIATVEARQSLLRMLTAQIDVTKATQLGRLAQDAAVIGLTNSSEAFEKLIYGIQSGQPRVLRTMGINVNFQESYEKLAKSLGKTTLELSDYEKVQARTNTVLEVAPRFAGLYEQSMTTVGKQITSLKRHFDDAKIAVGDNFQPALEKVVSTLEKLLILIKDHPELGVAITAAATGGLASLMAKMAFGGPVGAAVGIAGATGGFLYGTAKAAQSAGAGIAHGAGALFGFETTDTKQAAGALAESAAKARGAMNQTSQANLFKALGVPQGWMGGAGSFGESTEAEFNKSFEQWVAGQGTGLDNLKRQKEMSDKMLGNAYENKDRPGYAKELAHNESLKAQIKQYEMLTEARKHLIDLENKSMEFEQDEMAKIEARRRAELDKLGELTHAKERQALVDRANAVYDREVFIEKVNRYNKLVELEAKTNSFIAKEQDQRTKEEAHLLQAENERIATRALSTARNVANINYGGEVGRMERTGQHAMRMAEMTAGGDENAAIQSAYALRLKLAEQIRDVEYKRAKEVSEEEKLADEKRNALRKLNAEAYQKYQNVIFDAELEHEEKLAALQHKRFDSLKNSIGSILDAAFVKSKDLLSLFTNTIKAAIFAPIKEGLSNMLANALMPTLYGKDGKGGIFGSLSGMFGKKGSGIQDVQLRNGAVPVVIMGAAGSSGASTGMSRGYGGTTMPAGFPGAFGAGSVLAGLSPMMGLAGVFGGGSRVAETIGGGPSTAGLSQNAYGLWNRAGSAGSLMPTDGAWSDYFGRAAKGLSGGSGPGGGGLLSSLSGLKGAFYNSGSIYGPAGYATTAAGIGGIKGTAAGILTSGGAASVMGAVGAPLAMAGLSGARQGTTSGILMGTAGGALTGAAIGTMIMPGIGTAIGAGIGAAAGFATGMIEKLIGTKASQAHDQIKRVYGVDIPTNSGLMKQILQMIDQSFGGSISTGIRSPQIRELIQLYSEGTGQKMPLNPYTPRAAGLSSRGGGMYQEAFYQNGQAYAFSSSLPVLPGTGPVMPASTGGYAAPGGSVQFSLDGPATTRVLSGQVVNAMVPGLVH